MNPLLATQKNHSVRRFVAIAFVGFFIVAMTVSSRNEKASNTTEQANTTKQANASCVSDWSKCVDVPALANNWKGFTSARVECKMAAEERAKYETKWSWGPFSPDVGKIVNGVVTLVDDEARFQNGYGAMARVKVFCKYDLQSAKVLDVSILER